MHELPRELGNSLRSFRNSVHRCSGERDLDLEKLEFPDQGLIDGEGERHVREISSSLILVRITLLRYFVGKFTEARSPASDRFEFCFRLAQRNIRRQGATDRAASHTSAVTKELSP